MPVVTGVISQDLHDEAVLHYTGTQNPVFVPDTDLYKKAVDATVNKMEEAGLDCTVVKINDQPEKRLVQDLAGLLEKAKGKVHSGDGDRGPALDVRSNGESR